LQTKAFQIEKRDYCLAPAKTEFVEPK